MVMCIVWTQYQKYEKCKQNYDAAAEETNQIRVCAAHIIVLSV